MQRSQQKFSNGEDKTNDLVGACKNRNVREFENLLLLLRNGKVQDLFMQYSCYYMYSCVLAL